VKFAYLTAAALAALLVALPSRADTCHVNKVAVPAYHQNAVAVVAAPLIPLYGASYTGDADAETADLLKQLLAEIRALRADLQKPTPIPPAGGDDETPVPPLKAVDVAALVKTKCASCHTGDNAKKGFEMVTDDGKLVKLNRLSRQAVIDHTTGKKGPPMPPPASPQLTPAEKEALRRALTDPAPKK
jgi:mono/diheme cytochrome c family protein